eukprot:TRINITY_DN2380_c0_g4_i1.p1 TRINITY_DN2380_c0_g4~~TRINITY_DN2380_c0_g4_i1.p1  ORF type:complete len:240 (+),score=42.91 TRINITY_DN2380_c0_g4_i1:109-828(+)
MKVGCSVSKVMAGPSARTFTTTDVDAVKVWDTATMAVERVGTHAGPMIAGGCSQESGLIVTSAVDGGMVKVWNTEPVVKQRLWPWPRDSLNELYKLKGHAHRVYDLQFKPGCPSVLATASVDTVAKLWDLDSAKETHTLKGHEAPLFACCWGAGSMLATGGDKNRVGLWDTRQAKRTAWLEHGTTVWTVAFSKDNRRLLSAGMDTALRVWDVRQQRELHCMSPIRSPTPPASCMTMCTL